MAAPIRFASAVLLVVTVASGTLLAQPPAFDADLPGLDAANPPQDLPPSEAEFFAQRDTELASGAHRFLKQHCHRCHLGPGSSGEPFDALNRDTLVDDGWVVEGDVDNSGLWDAIESGRMPPRSVQDRPSAQEIQTFKQWIDRGAVPFPTAYERPFVDAEYVLTAIDDYLRRPNRVDPTVDLQLFDRSAIRFFTLHNLHNDDGVSAEELTAGRAALSKVINSLSWRPDIVVPRAIDEHGVVFAIDLRDYGWNANSGRVANLWDDVLLPAYPYGVRYTDPLRKSLQEDIIEATGCRNPLIRADWFVTRAMQPPLYHDLLQMPTDAKVLERYLGIDIPSALQQPHPDRIARAGMMISGVSAQNRLVERNAIERYRGAYWKSYDFKPDSVRANLARFPLGPRNLLGPQASPFDRQAFVHDGGEIIFHLPNGLFGYMLLDGEDGRIDTGPIDVVSDSQSATGTPVIVNGVSCMTCHSKGLRPVIDDIREMNPLKGRLLDHLQTLYPDQRRMDAMITSDNELYAAALGRAVGPFLADDRPRSAIETLSLPEPVKPMVDLYLNRSLGVAELATELDLEVPDELLTRKTLLKELGLLGLLRTSSPVRITRQQWEAGEGNSLMQELLQRLFDDRYPETY